MQAYEFINNLIPPLKLSDRAGMALAWMEEIRIDSLPVSDQGKFLGFISDEVIFDLNEPEKLIGTIELESGSCWVYSNKHIYDVLRVASENQSNLVAVLDRENTYLGVVTMEDLLEEIVGDIVDEHDDFDEDSDINNIIPHPEKPNTWIVQASTLIEDCNEELHTRFDDTDVDTMGGLVMQELGHVGDLEGESVTTQGWHISIIDVDGRFIKVLELTPLTDYIDDDE